MDKKTIIAMSSVGAAIIVAAIFLFAQSPEKGVNLEELKSKITYYYGEDCPHCKNILKFIEENKIEEKVDFSKKEVTLDAANGKEFVEVVKTCGIDPSEAGVPLVYADGKCFMGEPEVLEIFKKKAGISQ